MQGIVIIKPEAPFGLALNADQWLYYFTILVAAVMYACADALEANAEELGRLATMEQGMPLASGTGSVMGAARNFRYYADLDIPRITVQDDDAALIEIVRRPIGVIAAIKPWNVPIGMAVNTTRALLTS